MRKLARYEIKAILRHCGPGARSAEAGERYDEHGGRTVDTRAYAKDADLFQTLPLDEIEVEEGFVLDLYVYNPYGDLMGNDEWTVGQPVEAPPPKEPRKVAALPQDGGRYSRVNAKWPAQVPALTGPEALGAAKRLYRFGMGHAFRGRWALTSGNRFSYPRGGVFYVNAGKGWSHLVHDISHHVHSLKYPKHRAHDATHTEIERDMVDYVLAKGWLAGTLKRAERAKPDPRALAYQSVVARLKRWESRAKRAATAIKKLRRAKARHEKEATHGP